MSITSDFKKDVKNEELLQWAIGQIASVNRLDKEGRLPSAIRRFMFQTPARAILRACSGNAETAMTDWQEDELEKALIQEMIASEEGK